MSERAARNDAHLTLHIPGGLLLAVVILAVGWWGGRCAASAIGNSTGVDADFGPPSRVTALSASFENNVLTAKVLVEGNERFDPGSLGFSIRLDDRTVLTASGLVLGGGAWNGRSYVMTLEKLIPDGRAPTFLQVTTAKGSFAVSLAEALAR